MTTIPLLNMPNNRGGGIKSRGRGGNSNFKTTRNVNLKKTITIHDRVGSRGDTNTSKYKFVKSTAGSMTITPMIPDAKIKTVVHKFIRSYFAIFDQPNRSEIHKLYHEDSFFSLSINLPNYPYQGRNLKEVTDPSSRIGLLDYGNTNIAAKLNAFPPTEHQTNKFNIDIPFYTCTPLSIGSLQIVVSGLYKDNSVPTDQLRAFTRVFFIKHVSVDEQGEPIYLIVNDLFMIQQPSGDQLKRYLQEVSIKQRAQQSGHNASTSLANRSFEEARKLIVNRVMNQTKMNQPSSRQLLEENNWDEDKAMQTFNQLFAVGSIPQSYFSPDT